MTEASDEFSDDDDADVSAVTPPIDGASDPGESDRKRLTDRLRAGTARRAATVRRGERGALAAAVRELRSHSRSGDIR